MRSCLYEGTVDHQRSTPKNHAFRYRLFLVSVDLDELETLFGRRGLWSAKAPALAWFRRADYLGARSRSLAACVRELVEERTGHYPTGPISLLTSFRYFGFRMNPVSFYYCFDESGEHVEFLVAEVNNTPWDEKHWYVVSCARNLGETVRPEHVKEFHVSPFMPMELDYRWTIPTPGNNLTLRIDLRAQTEPGSRLFSAALNMQRVPLTRWQMARVMFVHPAMTMRIWLGIYWQALRLWWKGVPFVPHPARSVAFRSAKDAPLSASERRYERVSDRQVV